MLICPDLHSCGMTSYHLSLSSLSGLGFEAIVSGMPSAHFGVKREAEDLCLDALHEPHPHHTTQIGIIFPFIHLLRKPLLLPPTPVYFIPFISCTSSRLIPVGIFVVIKNRQTCSGYHSAMAEVLSFRRVLQHHTVKHL